MDAMQIVYYSIQIALLLVRALRSRDAEKLRTGQMGHHAPFYFVTQQVLDEVRRLAAQGRVRITHHVAVERAYRYGHNVRHLHHALREARAIRSSQPDQSSDWVVTGPDLDGDDLDLAIVLENDVIVITVF